MEKISGYELQLMIGVYLIFSLKEVKDKTYFIT